MSNSNITNFSLSPSTSVQELYLLAQALDRYYDRRPDRTKPVEQLRGFLEYNERTVAALAELKASFPASTNAWDIVRGPNPFYGTDGVNEEARAQALDEVSDFILCALTMLVKAGFTVQEIVPNLEARIRYDLSRGTQPVE